MTRSQAARRAVDDEVGRILDRTDDIPGPVALCDEFEGVIAFQVADTWLREACDDDLLTVLVDGQSGPLYEGLLAQLRATFPEVGDACERDWVDVRSDAAGLNAWVLHHRPHLGADLES